MTTPTPRRTTLTLQIAMTDRECLELIHALTAAQLAPVEPPPTDGWPDEVESPTGREPRLLWNKKQQAIWHRMKTEYEQGLDTLGAKWFGVIRTNALGNEYGDNGLWAALQYQMTGDVSWVPHAWRQLEKKVLLWTPTTGQLGGNTTRELSMEVVTIYDLLYPGLTEAQRAQLRTQIDIMFTAALASPVRTSDSDQTTGVYFGVAFYFIAAGDHHPPAAAFWANSQIGGYDATAKDRSTLRNSIATYMDLAAGGEWIESSEYNLGSMHLLMLGYMGLQRALGVDHFPEITVWLPHGVTRTTHMLVPGCSDPCQWGDEQEPRIVQNYKWVGLSMLCDDPIARDTVHRFVAQFGALGYNSAEPCHSAVRGFFVFDPHGSRTARESLPVNWWAHGQGILSARTSWADDASLFFAHVPQGDPDPVGGYVDHFVNYNGDMQLWRKGAWALTHPIGYGGHCNGGEGTNTMLLCGWGAPMEFRGAGHHQSFVDGCVYVAGTHGGDVLPPKYYQPPPHWFHEFSRSVMWIPGEPDILVVFDRVHAEDPRLLPLFERYSVANQDKMRNAGILKQTTLHMPVVPTISGCEITWPGAFVTILDEGRTFRIVDESEWTDVAETERHYHVRIEHQGVPDFSTSLMILQFGDTRCSLEPVDDADVRGVLIHKSAQDYLVLFNAVSGPKTLARSSTDCWNPANHTMLATVRQRTTPLSVTWTEQAQSTVVYYPEQNGVVEREVVSGAPSKKHQYRIQRRY